MIKIREPLESELKEMYELRWKINRKPFGLPRGTEIDAKEKSCYRVIAFDKEYKKIIGSARLTWKGKIGEISFVGVDESYRMQKVGKRLLENLHQRAKIMGLKKLVLCARKAAESFYKKLGYCSIEEYFWGKPYNQVEVDMELVFN